MWLSNHFWERVFEALFLSTKTRICVGGHSSLNSIYNLQITTYKQNLENLYMGEGRTNLIGSHITNSCTVWTCTILNVGNNIQMVEWVVLGIKSHERLQCKRRKTELNLSWTLSTFVCACIVLYLYGQLEFFLPTKFQLFLEHWDDKYMYLIR